MKLKSFYPLLFALFPILFLYSYNIDEIQPIQLLLPSLVAVSGALILLFILRWKIKDREKASIVALLFIVPFFLYGHIRELIYLLDERTGWNIAAILGEFQFLLFVIGLIIIVIGMYYVIKSHWSFRPLTKYMSITAIILLIISLGGIGLHEIQILRTSDGAIEYPDQINDFEKPDIYYIILDCYERQDTLELRFGYDNSEFIDWLTDNDFYVASKSTSNYYSTLLSLTSSLNMEYLREGIAPQRELSTVERELLLGKLQNNKISQDLKSIGYQYIYVSSSWFENGMEGYAVVYTRKACYGNRFTMQLIRSTALMPLVNLIDVPTRRKSLLYTFDTLPDLKPYDKPLFVLAHISCPHAPFVFGKDGEKVAEGDGTYVDQLVFVNKKVMEAIDELLAEAEVPPIIILQSDTGQDSFNILNAYYLPGKDISVLYETISPVNSFRLIFNLYFGTDYELLEDKSFGGDVNG